MAATRRCSRVRTWDSARLKTISTALQSQTSLLAVSTKYSSVSKPPEDPIAGSDLVVQRGRVTRPACDGVSSFLLSGDALMSHSGNSELLLVCQARGTSKLTSLAIQWYAIWLIFF
jgi:hypothetical protein